MCRIVFVTLTSSQVRFVATLEHEIILNKEVYILFIKAFNYITHTLLLLKRFEINLF